MIEVSEQVTVPSSAESVWEVLADPRVVAQCIPGAELTDMQEDSFTGSLAVRFGPMRTVFTGRCVYELDEESRQGRLTARGKDGRGATKFEALATFRVWEVDASGAAIGISGEVTLRGALATVVEAGATTVVQEMISDFAESLSRRCAQVPAGRPHGPAPAAPLAAASRPSARALLRGLWAAIVRLLGGRRRLRAGGNPDGARSDR